MSTTQEPQWLGQGEIDVLAKSLAEMVERAEELAFGGQDAACAAIMKQRRIIRMLSTRLIQAPANAAPAVEEDYVPEPPSEDLVGQATD